MHFVHSKKKYDERFNWFNLKTKDKTTRFDNSAAWIYTIEHNWQRIINLEKAMEHDIQATKEHTEYILVDNGVPDVIHGH